MTENQRKGGEKTFGAAERFENSLVSKSVLATLHDESQPVVDALMSLLLQKRNEHRTKVIRIYID